MDVLRIALIVLAIAAIWALIELALTVHKARRSVKELAEEITSVTASANDTIRQLQPTLVKVDEMVDDLGPAVAQLTPLVEKATTAVDVVTVDLASVNDILVDVSSVTDTASNVTSTVSKAANSAGSGVAGVVGKFTGGGKSSRHRRLGSRSSREKAEAVPEVAPAPEPVVEQVEAKPTDAYFTYTTVPVNEGE